MRPEDRTIRDLIAGACDGDERAFRDLWTVYEPKLQAFVRANLGRRGKRLAGVEDVVQGIGLEVFHQWLRKQDEAPDPGLLWQRTKLVALHRMSNLVTRSRLVGESALPSGVAETPNDVPTTGSVTRSDEMHLVRRLMQRLPPHDALLIDLVILQGLSPDQAAGEVGMKVDTLRKRVARIVQRLRELARQRSRGA